VGLGEAAEPGGVGADGGVGCGVEVAVAALLVAAEDDDGFGAGGDVVEEVLSAGEMVGAGAEVAAEERGGPYLWAGWSGLGHENCGETCGPLSGRLMPLG